MRPSCGAKASLLKGDRLEAVWGKKKVWELRKGALERLMLCGTH